jgi:hypothetical protein
MRISINIIEKSFDKELIREIKIHLNGLKRQLPNTVKSWPAKVQRWAEELPDEGKRLLESHEPSRVMLTNTYCYMRKPEFIERWYIPEKTRELFAEATRTGNYDALMGNHSLFEAISDETRDLPEHPVNQKEIERILTNALRHQLYDKHQRAYLEKLRESELSN